MRIHILAICGAMTTYLARQLQKQGHQITGSDQEKIYPPFSEELQKANIPLNRTPINSEIDLYIIGSAYKNIPRCNQEFQQIIDQKLSYISATEYLSQNLIRPNSILVAGSYGKTTISGLLVHILKTLNLNPSFFVGGQMIDHPQSLQITTSHWSVTEADESINGLDTQAKFLYYPVKYLLLTSAAWEHKDSYPTYESNLESYQKLIENVPQDGLIIYNPHDPDIQKIINYAKCPTYPYLVQNFASKLIGNFNQQNLSAVYTLCQKLDFDESKVLAAMSSFSGIKRRLEIVYKNSQYLFVDDFAQSPQRVLATISALKESFPGYRIIAYFEPHASFLQQKESLYGFGQAFAACQQVILGPLSYSDKVSKENRSTAKDYLQQIGPKCSYLPLSDQIVSYLVDTLSPQSILIHFSSGGLEGLNNFHKIISRLK